ncbi:MAG TPA: class I SAM-dependent methyltransferase [bacterium]|nr:class I SAM-dependent methyltransferase [bacterium]
MKQCLFCGQKVFVQRYCGIPDRLGMSKKLHAILECAFCHSFQVEPIPSAEEMARLYPPAYAFKETTGGPGRRFWNRIEWQIFYAPVLRACVNLVRRHTGVEQGKILDIGCGSGLRLKEFSRAGFQTEGVDFSKEDVDYAREKLGLAVTRVNIEEENLPEGNYELVMAYWVMEHLREPALLTRKIYAALKSGGWAVCGVPLSDSLVSRVFRGRWSAVREAPRHLGIPSRKGMRELLKQAGFQKVFWKPVSLFELAGDVALSLWPRGNFVLTQNKPGWVGVGDRLMTGFLTLLGLPLVGLITILKFPPGLTVFFAQK